MPRASPLSSTAILRKNPTESRSWWTFRQNWKQGKGIGYERWAKKHNLKAMAQTLILLQEKGLLNEDALDQRIAELDTKVP